MEKILTFPCCFFYRVLAPLDIVELDRLAPCDMTLLVQDIDRVLGICQVCFKWCPSGNTTSTVPSSTSSPEIHGRCRELLPTLVVTSTYMPRFHTSQELGMIQYNEGIASLSLQISSHPSFERRKGSKGTANSRTLPHYGNSKPEWREWRKSSLSHVASSTVWFLPWTLQNLIVLRLVTQLFWSKILIGCSGYVRSALSGATSGNTTSTVPSSTSSAEICGRCH
jgi:hypothetical protein